MSCCPCRRAARFQSVSPCRIKRSGGFSPGLPGGTGPSIIETEREDGALDCLGAAADPLDRPHHAPPPPQNLVGDRDDAGVRRRLRRALAQAERNLRLVEIGSEGAIGGKRGGGGP